ncbi:hypothetical protein LZ198_19370 [Myxococcus sp. K15C18031901]|uniref:hypothetical protein n=1 Tax=Myxococcus dinghuensis TaxID=2906761 RepID=UPI0020A712A2|nr:hypothetical protein [Myxococcus dinghuensis]MCP3101039.1 hypothetical protein [Myxococcus dinghuensis]
MSLSYRVTRGPTEPPSSLPSASLQDERLRRLEEALAEGKAREAAAVEAWVRRTGRLPPRKVRRKWEREWDHEAKRDARRAAARARRRSRRSRDPARAAVYFVMATTFLVMAMQNRRMWWLAFVALAFFLSGVKHARRPEGAGEKASSRDRDTAPPVATPAPQVPPASEDPRTAKVDAVCARLLAELGQGPSVLRDVVHAPERTVEALRKGCHELSRRERELRSLAKLEEGRELDAERDTLARRVEAERDAVVRERLEAALVALDEQRRQRAELATAADRLEAEFTRLYYTLEGLHAQVLRVRSAEASGEDVAGLGLRQSVAQLGAEVDAVAEALEEVHRPPVEGRQRTR